MNFSMGRRTCPSRGQFVWFQVQKGCGKLQQDRNPNPATCSQVVKDDKQSQTGCRKQQQALEIQLETTGFEYHNLQVTDYEYVEKVIRNLRHKLIRSWLDELAHEKVELRHCRNRSHFWEQLRMQSHTRQWNGVLQGRENHISIHRMTRWSNCGGCVLNVDGKRT